MSAISSQCVIRSWHELCHQSKDECHGFYRLVAKQTSESELQIFGNNSLTEPCPVNKCRVQNKCMHVV